MAGATGRFSNRVDDYVRARPTYPPDAIGALRDRIGLLPAWTIADIGAGTGISARLFLDAGCRVIAVEPNEAMRDAMAKASGTRERFRVVAGTAEATTLAAASVDLVVAAQAFHWFDATAFRRECVRILRRGGYVVLMWNERLLGGTPFLDGYERLLRAHATDYAKVDHRNIGDAQIAWFFAPATFDVMKLPNAQRFDVDGLRARLMSSSYVPAGDDPRSASMLVALHELFDQTQQGGAVEMTYETQIFFGKVG